MSEPENFLERWSKRKLAKGEQALEQDVGAPQGENENQPPAPAMETNATNAASDSQEFDRASLPPIESIGADTDVTVFLRPGIPSDLTRAALRRAWSSDPAIRDFVGLVENGWDFNDPQAMAGFGPIDVGEAARLLAQAMGDLPEKALAGLPKEAALRDAKDQPKVSSQAVAPTAGAGGAPPKSADVRRNIDVARNDLPQKESGD